MNTRFISRIPIALGIIALQVSFVAAQNPPAGAWTTAGPSGADVVTLVSDPTNSLRLFAGTELGVFRTDDGGAHWTTAPAGPTGILAFAVDPSGATRVWAGTPAGLFESTDGGASFSLRHTTSLIRTIAVDPTDPSTVYSAGDGPGVSKTTDGGETWTESATGRLVKKISQLVIDPSNRRHVVASAEGVEFGYFDYVSPQIIESFDAGKTWMDLPSSPIAFYLPAAILAFDPRGNGTLYAAQGDQVYRSSDNGVTWQMSPFLSLGSAVTSLVADPHHSGTLYAGTDRGAFQSVDAGVHWDRLPGPADFAVNALAFDAERDVLHAAASNGVWEYAVQGPSPSFPCRETPDSLCLLGGRFSARIDAWDPRTGNYASGTAVSETDGFGYFSFPTLTGDSSLPEVLVKMVDAAAPPWSSDWVFWGSLTDVTFLLTVTDTTTGQARTYENDPLEPFCGGADTHAFPSGGGSEALSASTKRLESAGETLSLLGGRLEVQMTASDPRTGESVAGTAVAGVDDRSGYFSLPDFTGDATLPEVVVKAIDATSLTGTVWFFYGGLTSIPYTLTIHNTVTGETVRETAAGPFCGGAHTNMLSGESE